MFLVGVDKVLSPQQRLQLQFCKANLVFPMVGARAWTNAKGQRADSMPAYCKRQMMARDLAMENKSRYRNADKGI